MKLKLSFLPLIPAIAASGVGMHSAHAQGAQNAPSLNNALADQLQYVLEAQDRYIVKFKGNGSGPPVIDGENTRGVVGSQHEFKSVVAAEAVSKVAGRIHDIQEKRGVVVASLDKAAVRALRQRADVEAVEPDPMRMLQSQTVPSSYAVIGVTELAQPDTMAKKVCVIDTGIDAGHEDLPDQNNGLSGSATGSAVGNWYNDGHGHGTHVAGTIAAIDNSYGSVGVYPGVNLHAVKVFDDNGNWTYASSIVAAVDQCAQAGADVVNMSLGGPGSSNYESQALAEYDAQGILMVAAAGNSGNNEKFYPASYDSVVSVAAVANDGTQEYYSQYNDQVELAAPGRRIYSTTPGNNYGQKTGTSMASPHVAGGAALLWSFFPQCTNAQIRTVLNDTALDKGDPGRDDRFGYGIVQVNTAYDQLAGYGCDGNGSGNPDPEPDPEKVTVVKDNLSQTAGNWIRFSESVPEGATQMTVSLSGGSGNADLFVKQGRKATLWHWDCKSENSGNDELCTFEVPTSGGWSFGIRARTDISGVTMTYSYMDGSADDPNDGNDSGSGSDAVTETKENLSQSSGNWLRYSVDIPEGTTNLTVELSEGTGDADLYINAGRKATRWHKVCSSQQSGNTDSCVIENPEATSWSIGLYGSSAFSGVTLKYSYE